VGIVYTIIPPIYGEIWGWFLIVLPTWILFIHNFSVDFLSYFYAFDVSISREIKAQRYVLMVPWCVDHTSPIAPWTSKKMWATWWLGSSEGVPKFPVDEVTGRVIRKPWQEKTMSGSHHNSLTCFFVHENNCCGMLRPCLFYVWGLRP